MLMPTQLHTNQLHANQQNANLTNFALVQQAAPHADEPSATVLLIEHDRIIGEHLQRQLESSGYRVLLAEEGATALSLFLTQAVDLILLDMELPRLEGFTLCTAIRQTSAAPILMLTPVEMLEYTGRAFQLGADGCLTKPLVFSTVAQRIQVLLHTTSDGAYHDEALIHDMDMLH